MSPSEFESLIENLKKLPGEFRALLEKRIELFTLEMGERITGVITHAIYRLTGVAFLALGLILVLFAASNFVGDLLNNEGLGFVVVAGPVLLLGVLFFIRRPRFLVNATRDKMLYQFMKDLSAQIGKIDSEENTGEKSDDSKEKESGGINNRKEQPAGAGKTEEKTGEPGKEKKTGEPGKEEQTGKSGNGEKGLNSGGEDRSGRGDPERPKNN